MAIAIYFLEICVGIKSRNLVGIVPTPPHNIVTQVTALLDRYAKGHVALVLCGHDHLGGSCCGSDVSQVWPYRYMYCVQKCVVFAFIPWNPQLPLTLNRLPLRWCPGHTPCYVRWSNTFFLWIPRAVTAHSYHTQIMSQPRLKRTPKFTNAATLLWR